MNFKCHSNCLFFLLHYQHFVVLTGTLYLVLTGYLKAIKPQKWCISISVSRPLSKESVPHHCPAPAPGGGAPLQTGAGRITDIFGKR